MNNIKLFQEKKIRSVLTDSVNPTDYPELAQERMKELYE